MMKAQAKHTDPKTSESKPKHSFDEVYKAITHILVNGTKEQQDKVWKMLNEGEGEWVWMKMKVITDAYSHADAKGKEEFSLIAMEKHLKSKNAKLLKETFTDPETDITYRLYRFKNGLLYRIPIATEGMDKYGYDRALNKKFLGDFIERHTAGENTVTLVPLDTQDKVDSYNRGDLYQRYQEINGVLKQRPERSKVGSPRK